MAIAGMYRVVLPGWKAFVNNVLTLLRLDQVPFPAIYFAMTCTALPCEASTRFTSLADMVKHIEVHEKAQGTLC